MIVFGIADEIRILGYSLLIGLLLGIIYDITRLMRLFFAAEGSKRQLKINGIAEFISAFIADILFFICSALIITVFVFHANTGRVRGYLLCSVAGGFALYLASLGRLTHRLERLLIELIRDVFGFILARVILPIGRSMRRAMSKIYSLTLGRLAESVKKHRLRLAHERAGRELYSLCISLGEIINREGTNEINSAEHTDKAGDLLRICLSDHNIRQRRDQVQRSRGGKSKHQSKNRGCRGFDRADPK